MVLSPAVLHAGALKHISSVGRLSAAAAAGAARRVQAHVASPTTTAPSSSQDLSYVVNRDWTVGELLQRQHLNSAKVHFSPEFSFTAHWAFGSFKGSKLTPAAGFQQSIHIGAFTSLFSQCKRHHRKASGRLCRFQTCPAGCCCAGAAVPAGSFRQLPINYSPETRFTVSAAGCRIMCIVCHS